MYRVHPDSEFNAVTVINVDKSVLIDNNHAKDPSLPQYSESAIGETQPTYELLPNRELTPPLTIDFKALETQLAELMKQYPRNNLTNQFNDPDMEKRYVRHANNGMIATRRIVGGLFIIFAVAVIGVFSLGWPDVVKLQGTSDSIYCFLNAHHRTYFILLKIVDLETLACMVTLIASVAFGAYMTLTKHTVLVDNSHIVARIYMFIFELSNI
ncbi:hypothetical protein HDU76_002886, partial [Blyttiomyces sp. JEL0837]